MKPDKELIIFDLDGTLAVSKSAIDDDMAALIARLLMKKKVAVISGGAYSQFQDQFLSRITCGPAQLSNLFLLPTSGSRLYAWQDGWREQYALDFSAADKEKIISRLNEALSSERYIAPKEIYGEAIEDRGSQITFSALGQNAPLELKEAWDPDKRKRNQITDILRKELPEFDIHIGGTTSIDITLKGVDKAYGIAKLSEFLSVPISRMLFVGDAIFPGGNDYPAKAAGVDCIQVSGPEETKKVISEWTD